MSERRRAAIARERELLSRGLAPRYRVGDPLGAGACGVVWGATRADDGLAVAVKFLHQRFAGQEDLKARFLREVEILARLDHPHVMGLVEAGHLGERPFLVMPRIEGRDLGEVLDAGAPDPSDGVRWLAQVASAVETAHALGVIHRDLKPANVMIEAGGDALVTDFGLASGAGFETLTRTGAFVGTPLYMAPEQFEGASPEASMDVYALAAMAFLVLEGRRAFEAEDLGALVAAKVAPPLEAPGVARVGGAGFADLVLQALDPDPAERPHMVELRAQLARRLPAGVSLPPPPTAPPPEKPPPRVAGPVASTPRLGHETIATPPVSGRGTFLRRAGLGVGTLGMMLVGFLWPRSTPSPAPVATGGPPPLPEYVLGLDTGGLELRFASPVGRNLVVRVEVAGEEPRRVELGPDDTVADVGLARRPDRLVLVMEDDLGEPLTRRELSLGLQKVAPSPDAGGWIGYPALVGGAAWLARGAGGFDRLVERDGRLEFAEVMTPAGGSGSVSWPHGPLEGGLFTVAARGARSLLLHGREAVSQVTLPGSWDPATRAFPLGEEEVLLLPSGPGAKILDSDSGVLTDLPLAGGYSPHTSYAEASPGFVFLLLRSHDHRGRLEVLRRTEGGLVPHATLQDSAAGRCHDFLSVDGQRDLAVVGYDQRLFVVRGSELEAGVHDLDAGIPAGVRVIEAAPWIPRPQGSPVAVAEGGAVWMASMARVPGTHVALMMEEFVLSRADLDDPTLTLREVYRHHQGGAASHMGTWAGYCRLQREPATGLWIAVFESDAAGENLLVVDDAGELRFEWRVDHGLHTGRSYPRRLRQGVILGEQGRPFWYLPLWLLGDR